jgi:hypothetical protein
MWLIVRIMHGMNSIKFYAEVDLIPIIAFSVKITLAYM